MIVPTVGGLRCYRESYCEFLLSKHQFSLVMNKLILCLQIILLRLLLSPSNLFAFTALSQYLLPPLTDIVPFCRAQTACRRPTSSVKGAQHCNLSTLFTALSRRVLHKSNPRMTKSIASGMLPRSPNDIVLLLEIQVHQSKVSPNHLGLTNFSTY